MNISNLRKQLEELSNSKFKNFSSTITKNEHPMVGVPIPKLRVLAKELCKEDCEDFLNNNPMHFYEEIMLQGFVIGYCKLNNQTKFEYLKKFIPQIKDWSQCDCVVSSLKFFKKDLQKTYEFLQPYFISENEFEKRFAIISFMDYFLNEEYIDEILEKLVSVESEFYYVKMGVAWALSVCFVKYYNKTLRKFKLCNLDDFTFNKTIQKCIESFRIDEKQKLELRALKRK